LLFAELVCGPPTFGKRLEDTRGFPENEVKNNKILILEGEYSRERDPMVVAPNINNM
jgi:hypothetical protein